MIIPLVSAMGSVGMDFVRALPAIANTTLATAPGREVFYRFTVPLMILCGPKNERSDYFIKSAIAAGGIIDIHWLAHIFTLFTSRVGGFFREGRNIYTYATVHHQITLEEGAKALISATSGYSYTGIGDNITVFKGEGEEKKECPEALWTKDLKDNNSDYAVDSTGLSVLLYRIERDVKVPVAKQNDIKDKVVRSAGWLSYEKSYKVMVREDEHGDPLDRPQLIQYYDVDRDDDGEELPTRAGITPFAYYWNYDRVKAYPLLCYAWSSFQSVTSTYVPLLLGVRKLENGSYEQDHSFSLAPFFAKAACCIGGKKLFTPSQWDFGLRLFWKKADTIALSAAYLFQAYDAGKRVWNAKGSSKLKEVPELGANLASAGFYGWMTYSGNSSWKVKMIAGGLGLFVIAMEEMKKASDKKEEDSYGLRTIAPLESAKTQNKYFYPLRRGS